MRADDHTMTILTGLVFAVVLGTMAQNSDSLMELFSDKSELQVEDDVFFVRAGTNSSIDLLANDYAETAISPTQVRITAKPSCGAIDISNEGVLFHSSAACDGIVKFAYCVEAEGTCSPAEVLLNVRAAPTAVADAYIPKKGDLVPLPLSRVTKPDPINRVGTSLEQAVKINAFVVTFEDQTIPSTSNNNLPHADELKKYLIDTSTLDLTRAPLHELEESSNLHTIRVPLSATRTARFLRAHDQEQKINDPARTYDTSTFNFNGGLANSNPETFETNDVVVPSESEQIEALVQSTSKLPTEQPIPEQAEIVALRTDPSVADLIGPEPTVEPNIASESERIEKPVIDILEGSSAEPAFEPALSLTPRGTETDTLNIVEASAFDGVPEGVEKAEEQTNACGIEPKLVPAPGAHVLLSLQAPCQAGQRVFARHAGIEFSFALNSDGMLEVELPALTTDPRFKVVIGEADPLHLSVATNDVVRVERSVVVTSDADGLRLAAVEFDPKTGQDRLTTAQSSISHRDAYLSGRGYVRAYNGKDGSQIEVYTLPMSHRVEGGIVKLNLIEDIGDVACAKRALVDFMHVGSRANRLQTTEVSIPDCSSDYALGDVIGNIRIATR